MFSSFFTYLTFGSIGSSTLPDPTITLVSFDNSSTRQMWTELNDPVMGGQSTGGFLDDKDEHTGIFYGNCVNVPSLKAPGFCKISTTSLDYHYPNISNYTDKSISLKLRTNTTSYEGFRLAFSAEGVPRSSIFSKGSFKAGFSEYINHTNDWQIVSIPFSDFSYDWSAFTGECNTTDPSGRVHHCCSPSDDYKYCVKPEYLSQLTGFEVWAEGVVGSFYLELKWIGVL